MGLMYVIVSVSMSESDITNSVKNGILYLEDPFDQVIMLIVVVVHTYFVPYLNAILIFVY